MLLIENKFNIVFKNCFLCPSAVLSSYLAKFHLKYSFIIKKYKFLIHLVVAYTQLLSSGYKWR